MERVVITIHPTLSDEGLLSVADAMQQVLDSMRLFEDAQNALGDPKEGFEWKLEKASTNRLALSVDEMHTYDGSDLLGLDGKVNRTDGKPLKICKPSPAPPKPKKPEPPETPDMFGSNN